MFIRRFLGIQQVFEVWKEEVKLLNPCCSSYEQTKLYLNIYVWVQNDRVLKALFNTFIQMTERLDGCFGAFSAFLYKHDVFAIACRVM